MHGVPCGIVLFNNKDMVGEPGPQIVCMFVCRVCTVIKHSVLKYFCVMCDFDEVFF